MISKTWDGCQVQLDRNRGPVALFNIAAGETLALFNVATGREEAALFNVSQVWMREGQTAESGLFCPQQIFQPLTWQYSSG